LSEKKYAPAAQQGEVRFEFQQQNPLATAAAKVVWGGGDGARASYFSQNRQEEIALTC
jgi:hypothetical protein